MTPGPVDRGIDIGADLCILQNMDFNATPTPTVLTAPIWRSCLVVMRRNMAVCAFSHAKKHAQKHSKHAGSGSGLL
jgi:hypothetical protein